MNKSNEISTKKVSEQQLTAVRAHLLHFFEGIGEN